MNACRCAAQAVATPTHLARTHHSTTFHKPANLPNSAAKQPGQQTHHTCSSEGLSVTALVGMSSLKYNFGDVSLAMR